MRLCEVRSDAGGAPAVTVLMGVYNGLPGLESAIESILSQTFTNFEFVIIDDASTDGSGAVIDRYATLDSRIRVVRNQVNEGLGAVLAKGVAISRGELVARMDADDVSLPERLEKQVAYFKRDPQLDVLGSYAVDVTREGKVVRERRVPTTHEQIAKLVWACPFIHPTVMFRRSSIERVGSYSVRVRRRQDYELWFRCVRGGLKFANIPEPLVQYHFSQETMRRNHIRSMWNQVKIGWAGCRLIGAPLSAYIGAFFPLLEAALPGWIRFRLVRVKSKFDPRSSG